MSRDKEALIESAEHGDESSTSSSTSEDYGYDEDEPGYEIVNVMAPPMPMYTDIAMSSKAFMANKSKYKERISLFTLYRYAEPLDIFLIILGMLAGVGAGIMMPMFVISMGSMIDAFSYDNIFAIWFASGSSTSATSGESFTTSINGSVNKLLYFGAINCVLQFLITFSGNFSAQRQCNTMRRKYFENAMAQEIGWFDASQTGALTAVITDIQQIQSGIGSPISTIVTSVSMFLAGFIVGFVKGWKMALVIICVTPILIIVVGVVGRIARGTIVKTNITQEEAGKVAEEIISCVRTVTAFSIQDKALERYNAANKGTKAAGYTRGKAIGVMFGAINFAIFGIFGLAFWYGSTLVTDGEMSTGKVLVVFMSVLMGTMGLSMVSPMINTVLEACGAGYEVFKTIDRKSSIDPRNKGGLKIDIKGNIEFKDISFRYPTRPEAIVLKNFSLKIKKGSTVALVGSSGSGKSTIVGLLERFYDVEEGFGSVYVDGHDIKSLNLKDYRSQVGIVTQEPILFARTIAQNIAYGCNGEATQEMIEKAAKEANAHDFIMKLPEGYNTLVGERGAQLSGGQKQRISIARALIRKPKILIFDEATSALDTESERVVQAAIDKVAKGHTCIIIAHRLSTVRNADCIVVVHKGVVVEKGNHEELMAKEGMYKMLVERQQIQGRSLSTSPGPKASPSPKSEHKKKHHKEEKHKVKTLEEIAAEEERAKEEEKKEINGQKLKMMFRAFKLLKDDIVIVSLGALCAMINGALMPLQALIMSEIMTLLMYDPKYADILGMTQDEHDDKIIYWAIGYVALGVAAFIANFCQMSLMSAAAERLAHYLRYESFKAMLRQETGWFDDKNNMTGILTTRLASDPTLIHSLTANQINVVVQIAAALIVGVVIGFVGYWKVALVVLATVPVSIVANFLQMRSMVSFGQKTKDAYEQCGRVASEALENARTVVSLGRENTFLDLYAKELAEPDQFFIQNTLANAFGAAFNGLYQFWVSALAFWYSGVVVEDGDTDFNGVMKAQMGVMFGTQNIGQLSSFFPNYGKTIAAAYHIFQLLDRKAAIPTPTTVRLSTMKEDRDVLSLSKNVPIPHPKPSKEDGKTYDNVVGEIEFKNVRFAYPIRPDQEILKGLNLVAKPKQTVALVGESGCGKSTTISLIERFYLPTAGQVLLDGHPIDKLEIEWLRSQIGLVSQEPTLFATSIRENIRYGKPDATDEEIVAAAKMSNAHTFISGFPDGYDTMVGEKGVTLSGGQKQRIAIARALIRNPKILLLDEATSALDAESEKVVQDALDKAREGRTTITIAHRLSTIKDADVILVFSNGVVVEKGKHDELLELNGLYYNLVKAQTTQI